MVQKWRPRGSHWMTLWRPLLRVKESCLLRRAHNRQTWLANRDFGYQADWVSHLFLGFLDSCRRAGLIRWPIKSVVPKFHKLNSVVRETKVWNCTPFQQPVICFCRKWKGQNDSAFYNENKMIKIAISADVCIRGLTRVQNSHSYRLFSPFGNPAPVRNLFPLHVVKKALIFSSLSSPPNAPIHLLRSFLHIIHVLGRAWNSGDLSMPAMDAWTVVLLCQKNPQPIEKDMPNKGA